MDVKLAPLAVIAAVANELRRPALAPAKSMYSISCQYCLLEPQLYLKLCFTTSEATVAY